MTHKKNVIRFICKLIALYLFTGVISAEPFNSEWRSRFDLGLASLNNAERFWGRENLSFYYNDELDAHVMKVFLPKGSIDPGSMNRMGKRKGGVGFKIRTISKGANRANLTYYVRFPENFDFVRGGKLPGLFGGIGNSGGRIPNGEDGFSFRLMWTKIGNASVYAYLPTSKKWGTTFFKRKLKIEPGKWHKIRQELTLDKPESPNEALRMWLDDRFIGEVKGLTVRTVDTLRIEGLFVDVFYGGNDMTWASNQDNFIEFAKMSVILDRFYNPRSEETPGNYNSGSSD